MEIDNDLMKNNPFNSVDDKDLHFMWEAIRTMSREQEFIIDKFQEMISCVKELRIENTQLKNATIQVKELCESVENILNDINNKNED